MVKKRKFGDLTTRQNYKNILDDLNKENKVSNSSASLFKKNLSVIIPKDDTIESTCKKILSGQSNIRHSGYLSKTEVKQLINALAKVKPNKINELILDQIFTSRKIDPLDQLIQIWEAAKMKINKLTFNQCTLPAVFLTYIKDDLASQKLPHFQELNILNCDIIDQYSPGIKAS